MRVIVNEDGLLVYYDAKEEVFRGWKEGVKFKAIGSPKAIVDYLRKISVWELINTPYHVGRGFNIETE